MLKGVKIIDRLNEEKKISGQRYKTYNSFYDDDNYILKCIVHNNRLDNRREKMRDKLMHYEQEYDKYINKIGLKLNDTTQDEHLFNLLNNNILLDFITL